jgi:DNA-binding transcriptional MerR regulator
MDQYSPIDRVAAKLGTTVESVLEFEQQGLLRTVKKRGIVFLSGRDAYKLGFILFLQRERHLELSQIASVLKTQQPPYDAAAVDRALRVS